MEDFLDRFFPQDLRESKVEEFINLKQGKINVKGVRAEIQSTNPLCS